MNIIVCLLFCQNMKSVAVFVLTIRHNKICQVYLHVAINHTFFHTANNCLHLKYFLVSKSPKSLDLVFMIKRICAVKSRCTNVIPDNREVHLANKIILVVSLVKLPDHWDVLVNHQWEIRQKSCGHKDLFFFF